MASGPPASIIPFRRRRARTLRASGASHVAYPPPHGRRCRTRAGCSLARTRCVPKAGSRRFRTSTSGACSAEARVGPRRGPCPGLVATRSRRALEGALRIALQLPPDSVGARHHRSPTRAAPFLPAAQGAAGPMLRLRALAHRDGFEGGFRLLMVEVIEHGPRSSPGWTTSSWAAFRLIGEGFGVSPGNPLRRSPPGALRRRPRSAMSR